MSYGTNPQVKVCEEDLKFAEKYLDLHRAFATSDKPRKNMSSFN